ncbi:glycosyltransferase family 61 protein [Albidovulum sp.]
MRNYIDFKADPEDIFLDPGAHGGLALTDAPGFFWRERPAGRIHGFAASAHPALNQRISAFVDATMRLKRFSRAVEFNCVPAVLRDAAFKKSFITVGDRALLNGASGTRLQNRYIWANSDGDTDAEERLTRYLGGCAARNGQFALPVRPDDFDPNMDFAVECRNSFNFYHFVTETLCQLCVLDGLGHRGRIFIHHPNNPAKTRGFTRAFIEALFPELADRVRFERSPRGYDRVLTALSFQNLYFQYGPGAIARVDALAPRGSWMWQGDRPSRATQSLLSMNSYETTLARLRARALKAVAGRDAGHLPRRVFVGRDDEQARQRAMRGEAALFARLAPLGFERVAFEHLEPLDQIAIMANAEVVIAQHGAGFTNMLFAAPQTHVIEIGTFQTARFRWGDFWKHAQISGCRYVSFYADHDHPDPDYEPDFARDGIVPVALSGAAIDQIVGHVTAVTGIIPWAAGAAEAATLATRLFETGAHEMAMRLLARHPAAPSGRPALCRAMAESHRARGEHEAEFRALRLLYEADPTRHQTLYQMIWCARKAGRFDLIPAVLERLRSAFPAQFEAFVEGRDWLRDHIAC